MLRCYTNCCNYNQCYNNWWQTLTSLLRRLRGTNSTFSSFFFFGIGTEKTLNGSNFTATLKSQRHKNQQSIERNYSYYITEWKCKCIQEQEQKCIVFSIAETSEIVQQLLKSLANTTVELSEWKLFLESKYNMVNSLWRKKCRFGIRDRNWGRNRRTTS